MRVTRSSVQSAAACRRRCSERATAAGLALTAALALMGAPAAVRAQTQTAAVQITIPTLMTLSLAGSFGFPAVTDVEYTAGLVSSSSGVTLTHRANVPYKITINAQGAATKMTFTPTAPRTDADPNKPVGDVKLQPTTQGVTGSWIALTSGQTDFVTRASRGPNWTSTVAAQIALSYDNDPPGTYVTTVVFTMVAQ